MRRKIYEVRSKRSAKRSKQDAGQRHRQIRGDATLALGRVANESAGIFSSIRGWMSMRCWDRSMLSQMPAQKGIKSAVSQPKFPVFTMTCCMCYCCIDSRLKFFPAENGGSSWNIWDLIIGERGWRQLEAKAFGWYGRDCGRVMFYTKLKNVRCEYDWLNGWNSTLQAAWYNTNVRWACLFYTRYFIYSIVFVN